MTLLSGSVHPSRGSWGTAPMNAPPLDMGCPYEEQRFTSNARAPGTARAGVRIQKDWMFLVDRVKSDR